MLEKEINAATNNPYLQRESEDVNFAYTQESLRKPYRKGNFEKGIVFWVFIALFRTAYIKCCLKLQYIW